MSGFVEPQLRRSLAAVYRFYDAFLFPLDERTPPIAAPLDVSIPALGWPALFAAGDATYRFSASTLTRPPPSGANLEVRVAAPGGDYISIEPILLSLPLPVSSPLLPSDFLIARPLWPTPALRPPDGETTVRGIVRSPTAQPVADLKVEMWFGGGPLPPAGAPYTRTDANGEFLFRFPREKGTPATALPVALRLDGGAVAVAPAAVPILLGRTQIVAFQRS